MPINTSLAYKFASAAVSSSALTLVTFGFTQVEVDQADRARITVATQAIRYRYDGGDPTATVGHLAAVDSTFFIEGNQNIQNLRLIRATGSDGAASITLEKI
jgi:hypothetical protein